MISSRIKVSLVLAALIVLAGCGLKGEPENPGPATENITDQLLPEPGTL